MESAASAAAAARKKREPEKVPNNKMYKKSFVLRERLRATM